MKILLIISICLCFESFSTTLPVETQSKNYSLTIHKSKRVFVKKQDRSYLRKKGIDQPYQKQKGNK